ncbi:MAG: SsrA-binding protein SmpB [Alphaproteobacteria bacterium]|nr:SsrA-binding protein SmpB [Alphaproteobacteria bacterium]
MPRQIIKTGQVAENRKARFEYTIEDTIEAGLSLTGAEVKSVRYGLVNITDAFVQTSGPTARRNLTRGSDTNLVLSNMVIQALPTANKAVYFDERRGRQLLLHRNQINRLIGKLNEKGATIVPLKLYFNNRGHAKVLLGTGFGKSKIDKRETIKKREWERDKARVLRKGA